MSNAQHNTEIQKMLVDKKEQSDTTKEPFHFWSSSSFFIILWRKAMTSTPCSFHLISPPPPSSSLQKLRNPFLVSNGNGVLGYLRPQRIGLRSVPSPYSRAKCWFRFGKNGVDAQGAGIYGSQTRDDFDRDDVEQVLVFLFFLNSSWFLDCLKNGCSFFFCFFF